MCLQSAEVQLITDNNERIPLQVLVVPTIATPISVSTHVSRLLYLQGLKLAHPCPDYGSFTVQMYLC
jgi:hypothetical protein